MAGFFGTGSGFLFLMVPDLAGARPVIVPISMQDGAVSMLNSSWLGGGAIGLRSGNLALITAGALVPPRARIYCTIMCKAVKTTPSSR